MDTSIEAILTALGEDVFENANTITKWLLTQPEESRPQYVNFTNSE